MSFQRLVWTPQVKQRPRTTTKGGYRTYTPKETKAAESNLRAQWRAAPIEGPVSVSLVMSDGWVEVQVQAMAAPDAKHMKGDIDNYMKLVMDALNGKAWVDDRHIAALYGRKV